jgi:xanthine dehydrogenase molybdopterin-binding subunit B
MEDEGIDKVMSEADVVVEGVVESHAQEHMYFEPQSTLAVPKHEQMEIDILCSTQGVNEVQVIIYSQTCIKRSHCGTKKTWFNKTGDLLKEV